MSPIKFKQQTSILAENQPEYIPLPVYQDDTQTVIVWKFTLWERIKILFGHNLYLMQKNFGRALQPQLPLVESPFQE